MTHQEIRERLPLLLSGELSPAERAEMEKHLKGCPECEAELEEFRKMDELLGGLQLSDPPEDIWEGYWAGIYNQMERGFGWLLFTIGASALLFFGFVRLIQDVLTDPGLSWLIKVGLLCMGAGTIILLISVLREQRYLRKRERYWEVRK